MKVQCNAILDGRCDGYPDGEDGLPCSHARPHDVYVYKVGTYEVGRCDAHAVCSGMQLSVRCVDEVNTSPQGDGLGKGERS